MTEGSATPDEEDRPRKKLEGETLEAFERSFKRNEKALRKLAEM